jgi:hypothetical protein
VVRRLPDDWESRYKIRPVLLETFVDSERFAGTCYKAANWIYVGKTKGRGKLGPAVKLECTYQRHMATSTVQAL